MSKCKYKLPSAQFCTEDCSDRKSGVRENEEDKGYEQREGVGIPESPGRCCSCPLGASIHPDAAIWTQSSFHFLERDMSPLICGLEYLAHPDSDSEHRCTQKIMNLKSSLINFLIISVDIGNIGFNNNQSLGLVFC